MKRTGKQEMKRAVLAVLLAVPLVAQAQTYSKTETIEYHDDTTLWVLGQVKRTTTNGVETSRTDYGWKALPWKTYAFGKLQQTYSYDNTSAVGTGQLGTLKTVTDGNNNVTTFGSWKRGIPQSIGYADGTSQSALVDDRGWITWVEDENDSRTCYTYDAMGRLASTTYTSESAANTCDTSKWTATNYTWEYRNVAEHGLPAGHWLRRNHTGNHRRNTFYDVLWRPVLEHYYDGANTEASIQTRAWAYDADGRVTFASYPVNALVAGTTGTWTEYDALGRVTSVSQDSELGALTTLTQYQGDAAGAYVRTVSPKGVVTVTRHQAFDQPSYDTPVLIDQGQNLAERVGIDITRDVFGKPLSIRKRNAAGTVAVTRSYTYNANQELCRTVEPETGATLMGYDGAGNLAWSAAGLPATTACEATGASTAVAARRVDRTHDARNRVRTLSFPDGLGNTTNTYTADGQLASTVVDNGGGNVVTSTYGYHRRGLPASERMQWGSIDWSVGYGYSALGHLASQSYPNGQVVAFAPNALGQPTQAGPYALGVQYHPNGGMKQFTYGNGIVHTMTQNARQLPARSTDSGGGNPLDLAYAYDAHANVAGITDHVNGRQTRALTYDGLDRLTQATGPSFGTATYAYNVLDNLTTLKVTAGNHVRDHSYHYDASNRLTSVTNNVGGATMVGLAYDAQGNLANKNGQVFNFDLGNRLRGVNGVASYVYDGHGRRVRDYTTASKYSLYSQSGQLVFDNDLRQAKATQYVYLNGSLVARVVNSSAPATPALTVPGFNSSGSYTVSWTASSGATGYELQEAASGGAWTTVYTGTGTSQAFSGKAAGNYGYRVRACLNAGCSSWSGTGEVAVQFAPTGVPVLSVPATAANGTYSVGWSAVGAATTYTLEESVNGGAWTQAYSGPNQGQGYTNKPAGSYGYRVKACNPSGCGAYSATGTVQAVYAPTGTPAVTVPASNNTGSYTVSWSAVATATRYQVEESSNGGAWTPIHDAAGNSKAVSGKGTGSHAYRARACNAGGCGGYSATATTQVTLPPTGAPTVTVPATSTGSYTVSWTAVGGATSYLVEEQVNGGAWAQVHNAAGTSKAFSGKASGTYGYRARACNGGGCGPFSAVANTVVSIIPPMPASLTGTAEADSSVRPPLYDYYVFWSSVPAATYYELQEGSVSGLNVVYSGALTNYITSGRGTRTYSVRACNAAGCSDWKGTLTLP